MLIELILQQIISGLAIGSMYSLVAMGYSMIWGAMEIVNFAQGELFMLGAVFGVILFKVFHIPFIITFAITLLLLAIIGIVVRLVIVKPLREKEHLMVIIGTASLSIVIKTSTIVWWGPEGASFPSIFGDKPMEIMRLIIIPQNLWIIGIGLFVMLALHIFLKNTRTGIEMRAVAQDRLAARLIGVSIDKTDTLTFAISSAMAAVAGILMAPIFYVTPDMGMLIGLKGFIAAIIGGFGSIPGAMIAGLMLGVTENIIGGFISSGYKNAIAFFILILVLYFLPDGILKRRIEGRI
jgi:branched-chain amino acid transport system permease protein